MSIDYKKTVILPATDFPMRAGLPKLEPKLLAKWQSQDLYGQIRRQSKGREKFVLHDGPPYANGNLHIGHALNKILKDVINRAQQMLGKDAEYVPGGIATACRSNGKSKRNTGRRKRIKTRCRSRNSVRNAANSPLNGSISSARNLSVWACWAIGITPIPP